MSDRRAPLAVLAMLSLLFVLAACVPRAALTPAPVEIHVLAINDFHGHLRPPAPLRGTPPDAVPVPAGGIDALAATVADFRARHPNTLVVSAGDLIGASPLVSALFHDEPTVEAMNHVGLDLNAVGNHEFDDGTNELVRMQTGGCHSTGQNTCRGDAAGTPVPFEGARFAFLAANVRTATGATLFPPYAVKCLGGVQVAFIGLTLEGTPAIVDRAGIAGLRFDDEAVTVNALVPELRGRGIEAIVVLLHEGGEVTGPRDASTLGGCAGDLAGSPLARIVGNLDDAVDLVISGHTHQAYVCRLPNAAGRPVLVTSAHDYGRVATEIALTLDPRSGDVASASAENRVVARSARLEAPDAALERLVRGYERLAGPLADRVLGRIAAPFPRDPDAAGESRLGALVADAQLAATRAAGAGIALMNPGGLRAGLDYPSSTAGEGDGNVTYAEAFTAQPFANALVTMTLTGRDLHDLLEQQFEGCSGQRATRILAVSSGFEYSWSPAGGPCDRIDPGSLRLDGRPVDPERTYRVTVNSFLAGGGDDFSVLARGTDAVTTGLDLEALAAWLASGAGESAAPAARIRREGD